MLLQREARLAEPQQAQYHYLKNQQIHFQQQNSSYKMKSIKDKYNILSPKIESITDIIVLSHAWKKAHTYIRNHNSYADNLHLDCSAIELEHHLIQLANSVRDGSYKTFPLRMIPAPKSALWAFSADDWVPDNQSESAIMRPLAHVLMRDQVISTALMLCVAECIESAQGEPGTNDNYKKHKTYSYGNRLHCKYDKEGLAAFSWGNSETYSKFSEDYKSFVSRPAATAEALTIKSEENTYVIKLDISSFYDNIDIEFLINTIKSEYDFFRLKHQRPEADEDFWNIARSILKFEWNKYAKTYIPILRNKKLPKGLPQGLTASGFFANAYLLKFDRAIASSLNTTLYHDNTRIEIIDYCRYVDDLRLVVSTSAKISEPSLGALVENWAQDFLDKQTSQTQRLSFNSSKTEAELFSYSGRLTGVAATMNALQAQLSGPFDLNSLVQTEAGLNGLLATAELGFHIQANKSLHNSRSPLAAIARPKNEVKDDTLTRFSAYRLSKVLREKRIFSDLSSEVDGVSARKALEYEFEALSRRLIGIWLFNPSQVQVLKYALNTFPSAELIEPILTELKNAAFLNTHLHAKCHAFYIITEIFRAAATETGFWIEEDSNFSVGDLSEYRKTLINCARELLSNEQTPWYAVQQASFFLSTRKIRHTLPRKSIYRNHILLQGYLFPSYRIHFKPNPNRFSGISIIGHQIKQDTHHHQKWFENYAKYITADDLSSAMKTICDLDYSLAEGIVTSHQNRIISLPHDVPEHLKIYAESRWFAMKDQLPTGEWISLADAMMHISSPFGSENALLTLALGICRSDFFETHDYSNLSPISIEIKVKKWADLERLNSRTLEVQKKSHFVPIDPHYLTPSWIKKTHEWQYALGRILRSLAIGEPDFTARSWILRADHQKYHGLKTSWDKRRIGISHDPYNLGATTSAFTPWISELITNLLAWPGRMSSPREIPNLAGDFSKDELMSVLRKRIAHQRALFGKSSNLPVYEYPISWKLRDSRKLRILMIQGLMPAVADFSSGLSTLDTDSYRGRHRDHLASILKIAHNKILARQAILKKEDGPDIDLVLIPEYGVHPDDQDLLRSFSDATGAIIFFGIVGAKHPRNSDKYINTARWLIPNRAGTRRSWIRIDQGKKTLTPEEAKLPQLIGWRPHQALVKLVFSDQDFYRISGAICYDATDLSLAADLRDLTHTFVVLAMNNDIKTFDGMVSALRYHMYQHIVIANTGEFGGSTAQAPYDLEHKRQIAHIHGSGHITATIFDIPIDDFGPKSQMGQTTVSKEEIKMKIGKTPPAGLNIRKRSAQEL